MRDYGDLSYLLRDRYEASIREMIEGAQLLSVEEAITMSHASMNETLAANTLQGTVREGSHGVSYLSCITKVCFELSLPTA